MADLTSRQVTVERYRQQVRVTQEVHLRAFHGSIRFAPIEALFLEVRTSPNYPLCIDDPNSRACVGLSELVDILTQEHTEKMEQATRHWNEVVTRERNAQQAVSALGDIDTDAIRRLDIRIDDLIQDKITFIRSWLDDISNGSFDHCGAEVSDIPCIMYWQETAMNNHYIQSILVETRILINELLV